MAANIWILGGYQSDFARNVHREGGDLATLTAEVLQVRDVRAEESIGYSRGFVAARPGPYFEKEIRLVIGIFRYQKFQQLEIERIELHSRCHCFIAGKGS